MLVTYNFIDLVLPDNDLTTKMINKYIFSFGVLLFAFNSHAQTPCIDGFSGDYDHLARYGEWDGSDPATPEDLT